jgi:hypothetical protein
MFTIVETNSYLVCTVCTFLRLPPPHPRIQSREQLSCVVRLYRQLQLTRLQLRGSCPDTGHCEGMWRLKMLSLARCDPDFTSKLTGILRLIFSHLEKLLTEAAIILMYY